VRGLRIHLIFGTRGVKDGDKQEITGRKRLPPNPQFSSSFGAASGARFMVPISEHFKRRLRRSSLKTLVPFSEQFSESSSTSSARRKNNSESDELRRRARAPDKPAAISAV